MLRQLSIVNLPLQARALAINTYCFSKFYYRDLHSPMDHVDLAFLKKQIRPFLQNITIPTLTTPLEFGGFGLLDMRL